MIKLLKKFIVSVILHETKDTGEEFSLQRAAALFNEFKDKFKKELQKDYGVDLRCQVDISRGAGGPVLPSEVYLDCQSARRPVAYPWPLLTYNENTKKVKISTDIIALALPMANYIMLEDFAKAVRLSNNVEEFIAMIKQLGNKRNVAQ